MFSDFPKNWGEDAIAGPLLPCRERSQRKVTRARCPQPGEERSCCGAISVVFNTKENLRDLGKQKGLLTKFRMKRDVGLNLPPNGCLRGLLGLYIHMLKHERMTYIHGKNIYIY